MAKSRKPQVLQNEVLARTLARQSKSHIAREMAIDRQTVTRIQECHNLPQLLADSRRYIVENVVPDAIQSLHAQIVDRDAPGDGDLAARLLEHSGVLAGESAPRYTIEGDVQLQQTINALLPPIATSQSTASGSGVEGATPSPRLNGIGTDAPPPAGASLDEGGALPATEPVDVTARRATTDALILERRAAVDRQCAENLHRAHEEQRKHPYSQRGGRRTLPTVPLRLPNLDWD